MIKLFCCPGVHNAFFLVSRFGEVLSLEKLFYFTVGVAKNGTNIVFLEPMQGFIGEGGIDKGIATVTDGIKRGVTEKVYGCFQGRKIPMDIREEENLHHYL